MKLSRKLMMRYGELLAHYGVTPPQHMVLSYLWKKDRVPLNELSKLCSCTKSNITVIIDNLEKTGFVERVRESSDRRVILVRLTKKGREVKHKIKGKKSIISPDLSQKDRKSLYNLLLKVDKTINI